MSQSDVELLAVAVALPVQDELAAPDYVRLGELAEAEGYHTVFFGEIAGARRSPSSAPWHRRHTGSGWPRAWFRSTHAVRS